MEPVENEVSLSLSLYCQEPSNLRQTSPQKQTRKQYSQGPIQSSPNRSHQQQKRGMIKDPLPHPIPTFQETAIARVICGSDQTFAITRDGQQVYSWGSNQNAKLGHSYIKYTDITQSSIQIVKAPVLLKSLDSQAISQISCGTNHALAISEKNNKVFGWGQGMQGRLGNGS